MDADFSDMDLIGSVGTGRHGHHHHHHHNPAAAAAAAAASASSSGTNSATTCSLFAHHLHHHHHHLHQHLQHVHHHNELLTNGCSAALAAGVSSPAVISTQPPIMEENPDQGSGEQIHPLPKNYHRGELNKIIVYI